MNWMKMSKLLGAAIRSRESLISTVESFVEMSVSGTVLKQWYVR